MATSRRNLLKELKAAKKAIRVEKSTISNGRNFSLDVKAATLAEMVSNPTKSRASIAVERNMSVSTVHAWARAAGIANTGSQHPNTVAGTKAYWANYAKVKAFNTPTVTYKDTAKTKINGIEYQGKLYK